MNTVLVSLAVLTAFLATSAVTGLVRRYAVQYRLLDVPNARSSHSSPVPRGGGIAIVVVSIIFFWLLVIVGQADTRVVGALSAGGVLVAGIGWLDDRASIRPAVRLAAHFAAAGVALAILGGLPDLTVGPWRLQHGWFANLTGIVAIVWCLNLFNFMDGIDGFAGAEAVFVLAAGGILTGFASGMLDVSLVLAACTLGFLVWNWPPARIFLGDVGSGYLGFSIAIIAVGSMQGSATAWHVWLILGALFISDATVTLVRRGSRRAKLHEPHRSHAYQRLARRWGSHLRVTSASVCVNLCWLLPMAILATVRPQHAGLTALGAVVPLVILVALLGAGRAEQQQ